MKILIDINHPAHVHYFRSTIKIMSASGHEFVVTSRNKEIEHHLLKSYKIPFLNRGKGSDNVLGKILYFFKAIYYLHRVILKFNPDLVVSFGTPYPAIASKIVMKPHISFYDTEHARIHQLLTNPFSKYIITPSCYKIDHGKKHLRFKGYMELCYLHPNYFSPDLSILDILGIQQGEKYVVVRFVSWNATHDVGHKGLTTTNKINAVRELSLHARVFISSEGALPKSLNKYRIQIPPEKMHSVLFYASLLYGESATMASESACLGTPSIFHDNDGRGYTDEQQRKYGMVHNYSESVEDQKISLQKAIEILNTVDADSKYSSLSRIMVQDQIDVTLFMVRYFEGFG